MAFQSTAYLLPAGEKHFKPATVVVDAGTGTVEIQFRDKDNNWFTPASADYTITSDDVVILERANTPEMQIIATGDAQFDVTVGL